MQNRILFDWLSFTTSIYGISDLIELLNLDDNRIQWIDGIGGCGYKNRKTFNGVNILYNSIRDDYYVNITGEGMRTLENVAKIDYKKLFAIISTDEFHVTRLDIAYDDFEGVLNMNVVDKSLQECDYSTKFKNIERYFSYNGEGNTIYFGSPQSKMRFRMYDKKAEQNDDNIPHWVRFEMQLRDERAGEACRIYGNDNISLGQLYCGIMSNHLNFIVRDDSNVSRCSIQEWWAEFLGECEKISIYYKIEENYNYEKLSNYVVKTCGRAIEAFLKINGFDELKNIVESGKLPTKRKIKYDNLVKQMAAERIEIKLGKNLMDSDILNIY